MAKLRQSKAFTLVESVVVLAIAVMLVTWPAVALSDYHDRLAFNQTIANVTSEIEYAKRYAILKKQTVKVSNLPADHCLLLSYPGYGFYQLKLDPSVKVQLGQNNTFLIRSGGTMAPRTISFQQGERSKRITMQLEWGKISFD